MTQNPTSPGEGGLTDLIAKLEAAEVGSVDLDIAVFAQIEGIATELAGLRWQAFRPVTTSLDAALALAERVLPGFWWLVRSDEDSGGYGNVGPANTEPNKGGPCWPAYAATPALALCIAILRARATNTPEAEGGAG